MFLLTLLASILAGLGLFAYGASRRGPSPPKTLASEQPVGEEEGLVCFPLPRLKGAVSVEEALRRRRSIREYLDEPLTLEELSQLLWAAYGVTETTWSLKTTPSAGGTYPLEIYAVVKPRGVRLDKLCYLQPGSYKYDFRTHCMRLVKSGDLSKDLYKAAVEQEWVLRAPMNIVIAAVFERTTRRYGNRGVRYVWIEAGHASQNIYLQAVSLGLGTVAIGAFFDDDVKRIIGAEDNESPLYIMPVGRPTWTYDIAEEELTRYYERNRGQANWEPFPDDNSASDNRRTPSLGAARGS